MSKTWYIEARVGSENHRGECVRFIDDRRGTDGEYINVPAEQKMAELMRAGEWQTERPTNGEWWVSMPPGRRILPQLRAPVVSCSVICGQFRFPNLVLAADDRLLDGALWQRRTVPADPFKRGEG